MRPQLDDASSLDDLIDAGEFTRRHTSPTADERRHMLAVIGEDSIESLLAHTVPATIRMTERPAPRRASIAAVGASRTARPRRQERAPHEPDRHGLLRHHHSPGDRAQRAGEPGVVHRVHAVPAGDQPGSARGAAQLPDDGRRAHRLRSGQRLAARRGHRRRRGDDDGAPSVEVRQQSLRRPPRHASADHRRAGDPRRAGRHRTGRRRRRRDRRRLLRRAVQPADIEWRDHRLVGGDRVGPRRAAAWQSSRPTCWRACSPCRPPSSAPTSPSARRSASACRWASEVRTPRSSPPRNRWHGPCRVASSGSAPTPRAGRRCASRCRRASSTSVARRRRRTSAPPRCCWPTSPGSTPRGTVPRACGASPSASIG